MVAENIYHRCVRSRGGYCEISGLELRLCYITMLVLRPPNTIPTHSFIASGLATLCLHCGLNQAGHVILEDTE